MLLWIFIAALTLIAIIYVCGPLLRSNVTVLNDIETEKGLYEARIKELDNEFSLGRIDEMSLKAAKAEEARKLLKLSTSEARLGPGFFSSKFPLTATAIFIPLFSVAIYMAVGTPEAVFQEDVLEETNQSSIEELMAAAEKRLEEVPDDLRGWVVVAPVYARQGKIDKAINAYENAIRLSDQDPELTFALGEILVDQSQGRVTDEALKYFQKTVELNSAHTSAKFMLGMAAFQNGQHAEAIGIWQALVDSAQGHEEWVGVVQQRIDSLQANVEGVNAPQLSQQAIDNASQLSDDERLDMINRMVSSLADKLEDDPSDKPGWARLIRSYIILGKHEDAEAAIVKAAELFPDDTDFAKFAMQARNQIKQANTEGNDQ